MRKTINDFINSIDTKLYSRIRTSKGDAECRRYLKEHLEQQLLIYGVVSLKDKEIPTFEEYLKNEGWEQINTCIYKQGRKYKDKLELVENYSKKYNL